MQLACNGYEYIFCMLFKVCVCTAAFVSRISCMVSEILHALVGNGRHAEISLPKGEKECVLQDSTVHLRMARKKLGGKMIEQGKLLYTDGFHTGICLACCIHMNVPYMMCVYVINLLLTSFIIITVPNSCCTPPTHTNAGRLCT